jgi:para-nitrobenzyl esterase
MLWDAVTDTLITQGIGNPPYDPTTHAHDVLQTFDGIDRP